MKFGNWTTTLGGIMAAFAGIPLTLGAAGIKMNGHFYTFCVICGAIGPVLIGLGAKGKDVHSTTNEVQQSTKAQMQ